MVVVVVVVVVVVCVCVCVWGGGVVGTAGGIMRVSSVRMVCNSTSFCVRVGVF